MDNDSELVSKGQLRRSALPYVVRVGMPCALLSVGQIAIFAGQDASKRGSVTLSIALGYVALIYPLEGLSAGIAATTSPGGAREELICAEIPVAASVLVLALHLALHSHVGRRVLRTFVEESAKPSIISSDHQAQRADLTPPRFPLAADGPTTAGAPRGRRKPRRPAP